MPIYSGGYDVECFSGGGKVQLELTRLICEIQHRLEKTGHLRPNDGRLVKIEEAVTI